MRHKYRVAIVGLLLAAACTDTDPQSRPVADAVLVAPTATDVPATTVSAPDEPTPDEPMPDEPMPDEPMPDEPMPDEPAPDDGVDSGGDGQQGATDRADVVGAPDDESTDFADDGSPLVDVAASQLLTDDPTFVVEPLRPFEVGTAATAPSGPTVDDSGAEQPTGWAAFDRSLDAALMTNGNTAASVAVAIGGELVHASAFGLRAPFLSADPADSRDRFRIASISKPITAITLLKLVELGLVGLDEPVGQLIADHLGVRATSGVQGLTPRRLLAHTSGFGKFDTEFFRGGTDDCRSAAVAGLRRGATGGGYTYSNMNFCMAGILIEAVSGTSYEAAVYEQVLTPLGLSGMRLAGTIDPGPDEILHPTTPGRNYMETLGGAGSWIATPSDLVTIMDSLDFTTPGYKPLALATVREMQTPTGGQLGQRGYGLGLISYGSGRYGHTGTIENTHAMVLDRGDGVTWAITVAGPFPDDTPQLESIINRAFEAAGFIVA